MATMWVSAQKLQENIDMIKELLQAADEQLDPADRPFYQAMLKDQIEELQKVQASQPATTTRLHDSYLDPTSARPAQPASPASSSGSVHRKRSIGHHAIYPDSKRPSMNPSPVTPNTPNSMISEPTGYRQAMAGPSRQQTLPFAPSRSAQSNIIDLTQSNSPSPDPFPELNNAFMTGVPQPAVAFRQEFMAEQDLAQFLLDPSHGGSSYAFQQHQPLQQPVAGPAYPAFPAYQAQEIPLYIGSSDKPWAPSDNEDEYGVPLSIDEAQAVENLLGNVSAHDAEDAPERREQTPRIMCSDLKEYQKIGLTWLIKVRRQRSII